MALQTLRNDYEKPDEEGDSVASAMKRLQPSTTYMACTGVSPSKSPGKELHAYQWASITSFQLIYSMINTGMALYILPFEADRLNQETGSLMVGIYLAVCGLTQLVCPIAGKFSDRCSSRWGRRRPYIVAGTVVAVVAFVLLYVASTKVWPFSYLWGLFFAQLSLNVIYSAQCGIPADLQPQEEEAQRGAASSSSAAYSATAETARERHPSDREDSDTKGLVSGFVAFHSFLGSLLAVGFLVATHQMPVQVNYIVFMVSLCLVTIVVCTTVTEVRTDSTTLPPLTWQEIVNSYTLNLQEDRDFFWVCLGRMCYYVSTSVSVFLYYYIRDMLHVDDETILRFRLAFLIVTAQLVGAAVAMPASQASAVIGRKAVIFAACGIMCITFSLYVVAPLLGVMYSWPVVLAAAMVYGVGCGAYMSVDYALALECLPKTKSAAESFGLWGVAGFMGSTIGPMIGGFLLAYSRDPTGTSGKPRFMTPFTDSGKEDSYSYNGYMMVMLVLGCSMNLLVALITSRIRKCM